MYHQIMLATRRSRTLSVSFSFSLSQTLLEGLLDSLQCPHSADVSEYLLCFSTLTGTSICSHP